MPEDAPLISFNAQSMTPPGDFYIPLASYMFIYVSTYDTSTIQFTAQVLKSNGEMVRIVASINLVGINNGVLTIAERIPLPEGFLFSAELYGGTQIKRGNLWAEMQVVTRFDDPNPGFSTVASGWMYALHPLTFPTREKGDMYPGIHGFSVSSTPAAPAVGTDMLLAVPNWTSWKLRALRFGMTCSAVVANRTVAMVIDDGAQPYFQRTYGTAETAGQTIAYHLAHFGTSDPADSGDQRYMNLPAELTLLAGHRIRTVVTNLDAGDQINTISLVVESAIYGA